jgi:hypothetical protein
MRERQRAASELKQHRIQMASMVAKQQEEEDAKQNAAVSPPTTLAAGGRRSSIKQYLTLRLGGGGRRGSLTTAPPPTIHEAPQPSPKSDVVVSAVPASDADSTAPSAISMNEVPEVSPVPPTMVGDHQSPNDGTVATITIGPIDTSLSSSQTMNDSQPSSNNEVAAPLPPPPPPPLPPPPPVPPPSIHVVIDGQSPSSTELTRTDSTGDTDLSIISSPPTLDFIPSLTSSNGDVSSPANLLSPPPSSIGGTVAMSPISPMMSPMSSSPLSNSVAHAHSSNGTSPHPPRTDSGDREWRREHNRRQRWRNARTRANKTCGERCLSSMDQWYTKCGERISCPCFVRVRTYLKKLMSTAQWTRMTCTLIVINTFILACYYYGISDEGSAAIHGLNVFFITLFALEMVLLLIADGPILHFSKRFNVFDGNPPFFVIVMLSYNE